MGVPVRRFRSKLNARLKTRVSQDTLPTRRSSQRAWPSPRDQL
jgi:hypothetical protein